MKVLGYGKFNSSTVIISYMNYLMEVIEKVDPKIYAASSVSAMVIDAFFHTSTIQKRRDKHIQSKRRQI